MGRDLSAAAGAVIATFLATALLLKLFQALWKRRASTQEAVIDAEAKDGIEPCVQVGDTELHEEDIEEGVRGRCAASDMATVPTLDQSSDGQALRMSGQCLRPRTPVTPGGPPTPLRPQTATEVLALQYAVALPEKSYGSQDPRRPSSRSSSADVPERRATADGRQRTSSPAGVHSADEKRPTSRNSTRSAWSDERAAGAAWSAPTQVMQTSEWWAEASVWWPEAVNSNWESPYRPSSRNSRTRPSQGEERPSSQQSSRAPREKDLMRKSAEVGEGMWPFADKLSPFGGDQLFAMDSTRFGATWEPQMDKEPFSEEGITVKRVAPAPPPFPRTFQERQHDLFVGPNAWNGSFGVEGGTQVPVGSPIRWSAKVQPDVSPSREAGPEPGRQPVRAEPVRLVGTPPKTPPKGKLQGLVDLLLWPPGKPDAVRSQPESRIVSMNRQLDETRMAPLTERKRVFRELQRQLHPDKNVDCEDDAKMAFQELMQLRAGYLRD